jgi:hypothetical protein
VFFDEFIVGFEVLEFEVCSIMSILFLVFGSPSLESIENFSIRGCPSKFRLRCNLVIVDNVPIS